MGGQEQGWVQKDQCGGEGSYNHRVWVLQEQEGAQGSGLFSRMADGGPEVGSDLPKASGN